MDSLRLGMMLGSFTFLFRFVKHSIRLIRFQYTYPNLSPSSLSIIEESEPESPLTSSPQSSPPTLKEEEELEEIEESDPAWMDAIAGAIAGLAILAERPGRRLMWSQQVFVRGLQGGFNIWTEKSGIKIPNGAMWLFGLSCGQIMYSWFVSFSSWLWFRLMEWRRKEGERIDDVFGFSCKLELWIQVIING
jgi:hypothetical protein